MIEPILREFPDRFESERLLIRLPLPGDGAEVHAAITESLDELRPWMPWAHLEQTVDDVEANIRQARADFLARRDLRLHLYLREDGTFVGSSGLHRIDCEVPRFEIGYWVCTPMAGQVSPPRPPAGSRTSRSPISVPNASRSGAMPVMSAARRSPRGRASSSRRA